MGFVSSILNMIPTGIFAVLKAALILVIAVVAAMVVKSLVVKLMGKIKFEKVFKNAGDAEATKKSIIDFAGKLVYLFVLLLFVPGIFNALGMSSVSTPIVNILDTVWGYVPNVLAAAIILAVGIMIAKLVRQILVPVFDKIKVDKLQEKAGIEVPDQSKLSNTLAYIVYVLILIPVIITALNALNISAISVPAVNVLNTIFNFIPNIIVGLIIIIVGCFIGKFAGQIVERLIAASGLDSKAASLIDAKEGCCGLSKAAGIIVKAVIIIFFVVEGLNVLKLQVLTNIGAAIIGYMPQVLGAVLVIAAALFVAAMAEKALKKNGADTYAIIAKCAILTVGAFMVLNQLGIATQIVNAAFILILAALAVAFAVAFGIGGRTFAANTLKKLEDKCGKKEETEEESAEE